MFKFVLIFDVLNVLYKKEQKGNFTNKIMWNNHKEAFFDSLKVSKELKDKTQPLKISTKHV